MTGLAAGFGVGVHFTSFQLLDSFALLTVQFGAHFEVDVLGISTLLLPPNVPETPIAEAQLLLKATIIPDEGIVLVQAQLTNDSYIFSRDCHLTGGFAFASWFKGEHAGDFVVSLGGYHPDFKVPAYYPQVPRVGFNWSLSSELSVKGGGYCALVPHAIMAGGYLNALFEASDVKAWFNLNANFLLMWKPFHYDAQLSIDIGAEVIIHFFGTHTIGLDASADLHLWGPDFGGHARVSLTVIGITFHFSIDFGASPSPPDPMVWNDFRTTFLPANDKIASLSVEKGLERTVKDELGNDVLVINRQELSIVTSSVVPIKSLSGSFSHDSDSPFGVAPMNMASVTASEHRVTFTGNAGELTMTPVSSSIPSALWGQKMETELNPSSWCRQ